MVSLAVYVRCGVDVLASRIRRRGRLEESGLSRKFLTDIQGRHDDWLVHKNSSFPVPAPVLVLDGNLELNDFLDEVDRKLSTVLSRRQ